jgi:hypothetical protein
MLFLLALDKNTVELLILHSRKYRFAKVEAIISLSTCYVEWQAPLRHLFCLNANAKFLVLSKCYRTNSPSLFQLFCYFQDKALPKLDIYV